MPQFNDNGLTGWSFFKIDENNEFNHDNPMEEISFTNSYNAKKPPVAGDNSAVLLWIVLLVVSGAAVTAMTLIVRARKANG